MRRRHGGKGKENKGEEEGLRKGSRPIRCLSIINN
jgi:hypothetical protein